MDEAADDTSGPDSADDVATVEASPRRRGDRSLVNVLAVISVGLVVAFVISSVVRARGAEPSLTESQVADIVTAMLAERDEALVLAPVDPTAPTDGSDPGSGQTPTVDAGLDEGLLQGEPVSGVTLSEGAVAKERRTLAMLRDRREEMTEAGTAYVASDVSIDVRSLTIEDGRATAIVDEVSVFASPPGTVEPTDGATEDAPDDPDALDQTRQEVERVVQLTLDDNSWVLVSIGTISAVQAPINGI